MRAQELTIVLALGIAACGGETSPGPVSPPDAGFGPIQLRGACPRTTRVGGFLVEVKKQYSIVDGKISNAPLPASIPEQVQQDGACALLKRRNLVCNPPCAAGRTCAEGGMCIDFPAQQDVGTVSIHGLRKAVVLEPRVPGNTYFDTDLPHPAFEPGDEIRLRSTMGQYGALTLDGRGVKPLELPAGKWRVERGRPVKILWSASESMVARIQVTLGIDQHGASPLTVSCDFPDTEEAEIPTTMVDALMNAGVSGFPSGSIVRQTVDSMLIDDGCIDLRVGVPHSVGVRIAGHTPCNGPGDCPEGFECHVATNTCRPK